MVDSIRNLLIVAKPSPLRDSLRALVTALPRVNVIDVTDDIPSALQAVAKHSPDLVLLGGDFPAEEMWVFLRSIKNRSPQTLRLMLADTVGQKLEMEAPNAEAIHIKGATPAELVAAIEKLLVTRSSSPRLT